MISYRFHHHPEYGVISVPIFNTLHQKNCSLATQRLLLTYAFNPEIGGQFTFQDEPFKLAGFTKCHDIKDHGYMHNSLHAQYRLT